LESMTRILAWLTEQKKDVRFGEWSTKDVDVIDSCNLLTAKPALFLVNMSKNDFLRKKNKHLPKLKAWMDENRPGEKMIPYSADMEQELFDMKQAGDLEGVKKFEEDNKTTSQMGKIVLTGYHTLQLIHFYTAGADEVKCWTIRDGWTAPKAAGTIHTDFERGFIKAEVYNVNDWKEHGSEAAVKEAGKYRQEGKNYVVKDSDIIFFKFNVTADKKK